MSLIGDPIISFGRNRSGQDSGDIDYSIKCARLAKLGVIELRELAGLLEVVLENVRALIKAKEASGGKT